MTKDGQKVYQHGTLALLVPGLFDGTMKLAELLAHGDTGIGTATGLNGEMIVLDGTPYLVQANGQVKTLSAETMIPFATVHFDQPQVEFAAQGLSMQALGKQILAKYPYHNIFFAVKVVGKFKHMQTRAVEGQVKPYPTLVEVANKQAIFEEADSQGTVVGYFAPELFQGMAAAGYHLHYLNDAKKMGGHILGFEIDQAQVYLQPFATIEQHLPVDNQEFMEHQADLESMGQQIKSAEEAD